jgi:predicted kinase
VLIVFGGLPGTGKSTLAHALSEAIEAVWLRIDTIEQGIRDGGYGDGDIGPMGYVVGYGLASDNLRLGHAVVADSVNPVGVTRDAWRAVGLAAEVRVIEIEVVCSDPVAHRRRVETRTVGVPGLRMPTWADVVTRTYEPWPGAHVVDTAGRTVPECLAEVVALC